MSKDRVIWVCRRCWPHNHEELTLGPIMVPKKCDACGEDFDETKDDRIPLWYSMYESRCVRHFRRVLDALKVLAWNRRTREYLALYDSKALKQAEDAIKQTGDQPACGWENLDSAPPEECPAIQDMTIEELNQTLDSFRRPLQDMNAAVRLFKKELAIRAQKKDGQAASIAEKGSRA